MNRKYKLLEHLSDNGKMYELMVGNIVVEMDYSKKGKKFDECILNILKQKNKKG